MNSQENQQKLSDHKAVIDYLCEKFPKCFIKDGEAKPLKIGIFKDLAERLDDDEKVSRTMLRNGLRHYTSSWRYLRSIQDDAMRVDLDGNDCEKLEAEHVEHAQEKLKESKQRAAAKRNDDAAQRNKGKKGLKRTLSPAKNKGPRGDKKVARGANVKVAYKKSRKVSADMLREGVPVKVKLGKAPIPGQVKEIGKDGILVELVTGMVVKTQLENLIA